MSGLSDRALDHLRRVAELPDLRGTRYEIVEPLARGGMGTVYRARDVELDREVALKVLDEAGLVGSEVAAREARILGALEHPGIVPVHDAGRLEDGRAYYTMKLVRGERLDAHLSGLSSLRARLRVLIRVAETVAFAHAHGVVHRDIKPANVLVGAFGEVLVVDWGIAKVFGEAEAPAPGRGGGGGEPGETKTLPGTVLGTPGYMAPEQAAGRVEETDARADVYALGGLLAEVLEASTEAAPRRLRAIRDRAREEEPDRRYASAADFAADLGRFLDGEAVAAHREGLLERSGRLAYRYRAPLALFLAYLVGRLAIAVFFGA